MSAIRILEPSGSNGSIQIYNGGEFDHSPDLFFDIDNSRLGVGTTTPEQTLHIVGDTKIDGILTVTEFKTNVVTTLHQEGSTEFGNTTDDTHLFTGPATFSTGLSGSLTTLSDGSSYLKAGDGILITSASNGAVTIQAAHTVDGDVIIGPAEDGDYTDGLFTDITSSTTAGLVVDRFNEVLKALAPSPAPAMDNIGYDITGTPASLSFGASNTIAGYSNSGTAAGHSSVDVNGNYISVSSGNNHRLAVFDGTSNIIGKLNDDIFADLHSSGQINYPANSFGDANQGELQLIVNGTIIHTIDLTNLLLGINNPGSGTGEDANTNGSGFTYISQIDNSYFADGTPLDLFQHRTAGYIVNVDDQRNGWNYLKVIHSIGGNESETNYIEWINDSDTNDMSQSGTTLDAISLTGLKYISGVKYYTGGTAQYTTTISNAYRNIYSTSAITFSTLNCSAPSISRPIINTATGEDHTKQINVNTTLTVTAQTLTNESVTIATNISHPLKSNIVNGDQLGITEVLLNNKSETSSALSENFTGEGYRMMSGDYSAQADITALNYWSSTASLLLNDGMLVFNEALYSPTNEGLGISGDFTSITNAPTTNVDYSSLTTGTRTYYRRFENTSGGSQSDLSIVVNGTGVIVQHGSSYGSSGISISAKIPLTDASQSTGWLDLSLPFATGQYADDDGCLQGALDSSLNASNTITFGTKFLNDGEHIIIKIECDASYTGQIDSITVDWG